LPGSAFTPVWTDPSAAGARGRRWRAARSDAEIFIRTSRDPDDAIPDSYQAFVGIESPDTGLRWPESTLFKVLDDLSTPAATLDWTIHLRFDSAEVAVATAHNVILNIKDQARQLGRHAHSDDALIRKLASGRQLASALKSGSAERGVNAAAVIAVAGADPQTVDTAITEVIARYRRQRLDLRRRRGSQPTLWRAYNPGTETTAALHEIRNPTTVAAFAKFVPLLGGALGNNTGVPLGQTITSPGLREVVLCDLLNAPVRDNPANLVIGGSPGRGKSQCAKNLILSWLRMGVGVHLIDPTEAREHERALSTFDDDRKTVIDARRPRFTLDGLRLFAFGEAAERTVDHLLPQMSFSPVGPQAARLKGLLAPASRHANGIGSTNALIGYLADRTRADRAHHFQVDDDLLIALEGMRAERLLAPMFDESAPLPDLSRQLVIWNFGGLTLPTVTEDYQPHLHQQASPSTRGAAALYGMAAELAQSLFFSRDGAPDVFVVEEAAAWTHSVGGQKCANTLIRQGRKAWTGFLGISQSPRKDFGVLEDHFIEQRICLGFKDSTIAEDTLLWCDRDLNRHPKLLADYLTNTSPAQLMRHGDDTIDHRHGRVIAGREGEAWMLDEFGGWGKVRLFAAPTPELAQLYDTNPYRKRLRSGIQ
jgi:AAA domain-containing protein